MSLFDANHDDGNPRRPSATDPVLGTLGRDEVRCAACGLLLVETPLPCALCGASFCASAECHAKIHDLEAEEALTRERERPVPPRPTKPEDDIPW